MNKLNNMYKDINILDDKISIYYLNNNSIPTDSEKIEFEHSINPNDSNIYWKIDLKKLENISLNFGSNRLGEDDIYIINDQSHTIYYLKGVKYKGKNYYSIDENYELVNLEKYR